MRSNIRYKILSSGSKGNATIINETILIDCGVPFKVLKPYYMALNLVLLTHVHGDHFKKSTVKTLANERPSLRFGCGSWFVPELVNCGVRKSNIDILEDGKIYGYGMCSIITFSLTHNVQNCGYKLHFPSGKMIYATDTNNLDGITAKDYDLYMIEANYEDEEIQERIRQKQENEEYAYEFEVIENHLSKAKCDEFILQNISNGEYVYLHRHKDGESINDNNSENNRI